MYDMDEIFFERRFMDMERCGTYYDTSDRDLTLPEENQEQKSPNMRNLLITSIFALAGTIAIPAYTLLVLS